MNNLEQDLGLIFYEFLTHVLSFKTVRVLFIANLTNPTWKNLPLILVQAR